MNRSQTRIFLSSPHMGDSELRYVNRAFETNWIAPLGENVDEFERKLSVLHENRHVVALSSGTAALHLALIRAGVGRGDVVLCQSFTFSASANPICYLGAEPVFIGSEIDTWNAAPESLEVAIIDLKKTGRTVKAFVPVHLYGVPAKMDELLEVCNRHGVIVIEDAAESLGSMYKSRPTGIFGQFGILSFNGNKIITTSGGGALICPSREEAEKIKFLATQARDPAPYYLHSEIGYNYRLSNVCAGIGRGQLEVLQTRIEQRRAVYERYRQMLRQYPEIEFLPSAPGVFENRWLTAVTLERSFAKNINLFDQVIKELDLLNIECRPLWKPLHTQPVFNERAYYGNDTESDLFQRGLCLPSGSNISPSQQEFVVEALVSKLGLKR